ncbi:MAG: RNA polymerase sigma factor [Planctomycetota bacterium]
MCDLCGESASEQRLLQLAARGDEAAFELLHERLYKPVVAFLARLDGHLDARTRDELAHDVFVRVWESAGAYAGASSVRTYVFAITRNVLYDELRRRAKWPIRLENVPEENPAVVDRTTPDAAMVRGERHQAVRRALGRLNPIQRQAFELAHLQHVPPREAAARMGCSVHQYLNRVYRARKMLRHAVS